MKKIIFILLVMFLLVGCSKQETESKIIIQNLEEAKDLYSKEFMVTFGDLASKRPGGNCDIYHYNVTVLQTNDSYTMYVSECSDHFYFDTKGLVGHNIYKDGRIEEVQDYD